MALSRQKVKGRKTKGRFLALPASVVESDEYKSLSGNAVKLLLALLYQYKGRNNGDLSASYTIMRTMGFVSKDTLQRAKNELLESGLITQTREGRFLNPGGVCALYALTWLNLDECGGKLDVASVPTRKLTYSL